MSDIELDFNNEDAISINDGSIKSDEIKIKKPKNFIFKPKPAFKPKSYQPAPSPVPHPMDFDDKTFETFSNPAKKINERFVEEDDNDSVLSDAFEDEPDEPQTHTTPSAGFKTIEDEKQDLLYKFYRLESKGFQLPRKFNMHSDINDMRSEFNKIKRDAEIKSSLKFSRRMLMACVSGMEFLNKSYDPIGMELNGWSETVMENLNDGDYDNAFERLHDKYAGKVNTPPELELMLSLAGSAIMFHMTSTMFKSIPDPSFMQNMMKNMQQQKGPTQESTPGNMKGPPMDISGMMGSFFPSHPPPPHPNQIPVEEPESSIMSDDSALSDGTRSQRSEIKSVALSEGSALKKRGRKTKIVKENVINI